MAGLIPDLPKADHFGVLAEYETPAALYHACEKVRDAGFTRWDAHCPFPVHGLDKAMGIPQSKVPVIVLIGALLGASGAMTMEWWMSSVDYKMVISGKPFFSWPAYIPVCFALGILGGVFGSVFGMLALNQLPTFFHPLFKSEKFERATDDRFFISVQADDPRYNQQDVKNLLESTGAISIEVVENE